MNEELILDVLRKICNDDLQATAQLLQIGKVEVYREEEDNVLKETVIFTDEDNKEYSYTNLEIIKKTNNDLGKITLKSGSSFTCTTYEQAINCLNLLQDRYNLKLDEHVNNNEFMNAASCRNAITEIREKLSYYEQKQGQSSKNS